MKAKEKFISSIKDLYGKFNSKDKILSSAKELYKRFRSLSKSKQIGIVFIAIIILFYFGKSSGNQSPNFKNRTSSEPASSSNINQRVADSRLALSSKLINLPYNIGGITITNMSAYRYIYSSDMPGEKKRITWRVDLENNTNSEIQTVINICDSNATAVGNLRLKQAYLADCSGIELRMLPNSISTKNDFAKSYSWYYPGDPLRICIQGKGCYVANTFERD